jgi:DNA-binding transcriptional MerR regulator
MLKIGDFSKLTQVSVRMLRYYDNQNLLKPSRIDPVTGYRMYDVGQVAELQKIVLLRDLGFGVNEIAETLQNWDDMSLIQRLRDKIGETEAVIAGQMRRIENIEKAITHIENREIDKHYNVIIKAIPPIKVISLRRKMLDYFDEGLLWQWRAPQSLNQFQS